MTRDYYKRAKTDIEELQKEYPFTNFSILPTVEPMPIRITTIAANIRLINQTCAVKEDFLGKYSRELEIIVPFDYEQEGCEIYGGRWIDEDLIVDGNRHFYERDESGLFLFCVGVPESFTNMKNVILENVRTAEEMLIAYEMFQTGKTKDLELIAYSHGDRGRNEYKHAKKKYRVR